MIRLVKATGICPECGQKFHQIDGTEERAVAVVDAAVSRHLVECHPGRREGTG